MAVNKDRAQEAISNAEREFRNALASMKAGDHTGALKYFQECTEYATKAVLMAYGYDYPKIHEVGRFLLAIRQKFPPWFLREVGSIAQITDDLARGRPRFRYPYEHPPEQYEATVKEVHPNVKRSLESCRRLVKELFR